VTARQRLRCTGNDDDDDVRNVDYLVDGHLPAEVSLEAGAYDQKNENKAAAA